MNVLGAFSFGGLIKTFFPGLVWVLVFALVEDNVHRMSGTYGGRLFEFAMAQPSLAALVAIPVAVVLGILSNIAVFLGINDWLVRDPVQKANAALWCLHERTSHQLLERQARHLEPMSGDLKDAYYTHVDAEVVVLGEMDLQKVVHIREQYWYYLEFCMNLLFAGSFLVIGVIWQQLMAGFSGWVIAGSVLWAGLGFLLFKAARKNYLRHIGKMTSLFVAALGHE